MEHGWAYELVAFDFALEVDVGLGLWRRQKGVPRKGSSRSKPEARTYKMCVGNSALFARPGKRPFQEGRTSPLYEMLQRHGGRRNEERWLHLAIQDSFMRASVEWRGRKPGCNGLQTEWGMGKCSLLVENRCPQMLILGCYRWNEKYKLI